MKLKDVSISKGMTIGLEKFSSHRVEVGITASFEDGDDIATAIEQVTTLVNKKLAKEVSAFMEGRQTLMEKSG